MFHFFIKHPATKPRFKQELGKEIMKAGYYAYTISVFEMLLKIFVKKWIPMVCILQNIVMAKFLSKISILINIFAKYFY